MKKIKLFTILSFCVLLLISSCNGDKNKEEYVKKVQLKRETIAVGIYKPTGIEPLNVEYIAEAIKIDAGMVYVTLTDADILKTKIENIDVLIIPGLNIETDFIALDDELVDILKKFVITNGRSLIVLGNGCKLLSCGNEDHLEIDGVQLSKEKPGLKGLVDFEITLKGEELFPELIGFDNLHTFFNGEIMHDISADTSQTNSIANIKLHDSLIPIIFKTQSGLGDVLFVNAQFEATPGMRWVLPRLIRWTQNKPMDKYENNIVRPDVYKSTFIINDQLNKEIADLKQILRKGNKKEALEAFEKLNNYYPWLFAEEVRPYLTGRNDHLKLNAAEFIVNNEYTIALSDFDIAIKTERNKKNKALLREYKESLEKMIEQN